MLWKFPLVHKYSNFICPSTTGLKAVFGALPSLQCVCLLEEEIKIESSSALSDHLGLSHWHCPWEEDKKGRRASGGPYLQLLGLCALWGRLGKVSILVDFLKQWADAHPGARRGSAILPGFPVLISPQPPAAAGPLSLQFVIILLP